MKTLLMVSFALSSSLADAHWWPHQWQQPCDYPESSSTVIEQDIASLTSACALFPLEIVRTPWNQQTVDAWQGGYYRTVMMHTTYRIDHLDHCSGSVLWSESKEGTLPGTVSFNIDNPNLAPDQPSYVANAPLTRKEAAAELPAAKAECEAVKPGDPSALR